MLCDLVAGGVPDEVYAWQVTERRYLSESSIVKLYEIDNHGAGDKEVGAKIKELLAG